MVRKNDKGQKGEKAAEEEVVHGELVDVQVAWYLWHEKVDRRDVCVGVARALSNSAPGEGFVKSHSIFLDKTFALIPLDGLGVPEKTAKPMTITLPVEEYLYFKVKKVETQGGGGGGGGGEGEKTAGEMVEKIGGW